MTEQNDSLALRGCLFLAYTCLTCACLIYICLTCASLIYACLTYACLTYTCLIYVSPPEDLMRKLCLSTLLLAAFPALAMAGEISVEGAYARSNSPVAKVGAVFMEIRNDTDHDVRLTGATTPAAQMVQIHAQSLDANGVASMTPLTEGLPIPAGQKIALQRGGTHMMLMGLSAPLKEGGSVPVTLSFDGADDLTLEVPVDLQR